MQRWSRKQSSDGYDGSEEKNGKFAGREGGQGFDGAVDEKQGCGIQSGQGVSQVWEPWMQRYFQSRQQQQQLATSRKDNLGFLRRRQSNSLRRYFQSSPRNMVSPRLTGYVQLPSGQSPALVVRRPPLGTITNTPTRFGPKTTNTLKMLKSVVKTPSNILKRLQGNMRIQLGKAKRLFQGATRNTGGESLAHVLTMESVEMGLLLEPFLQMPGQLKRGMCKEDEGEWEEVKVVKRPYRKVEEEVEDLMSPDWREMKEVS